MLIILYLSCSQSLVFCRLNTWQFIWKLAPYFNYLHFCAQLQLHTDCTAHWILEKYHILIWPLDYLIVYVKTRLSLYYAGITKPPIMPKAIINAGILCLSLFSTISHPPRKINFWISPWSTMIMAGQDCCITVDLHCGMYYAACAVLDL